MSWTFNSDFTTTRDQIRTLIGDIDTTDQQISDEAIAWIVSDEGSLHRAAASCAVTIAAKYGRMVDYAINRAEVNESLSQRQKAYLDLAADLRRRASRNLVPYVGGQSIAEKQANAQDTDMVQPAFAKDAMTIYGTSPNDPENLYDDIPTVSY